MFTHAIVRKPGVNNAQGITTAALGKSDYQLMLRQPKAYIQALESLGIEVFILQAEPNCPDAYFVEEVAVVTSDIAVITSPGAAVCKGEQDSIEPPGLVDSGDVLMVGRHFFIGISEHTNVDGANQLGRILEQHGTTWTPVELDAYQKIIFPQNEAYAANTLRITYNDKPGFNYLIHGHNPSG